MNGLLPLVATLLLSAHAAGHPLSQGALDVTVHDDRVAVRARVTLEEVLITDLLVPADEADGSEPRSLQATCARHADYLAKHLHVSADGQALVGRAVNVAGPATQPASAEAAPPDKTHANYELVYPLAKRPQKIGLSHDVLVGIELAPGITWEASYVVRIGVNGGPATEGLLLTSTQPIEFACDTPPGAPQQAGTSYWRMSRDYFVHGVHHILTGYDHLLFISALVLAAVSLWDLVKVVTAFTLAHTITLTLASLRLVSLPEWIVEPMIAASIVFVAVQNVFWPRQARGWGRLAIAFGFGLFHGLGFAGGLLEAMWEMSGVTIAVAIVAFSVGVEVGHQVIVIPLFALLKLARRTSSEIEDRDRVSLLALRYGSAAICFAGVYYLVGAVSSAIAVANHA